MGHVAKHTYTVRNKQTGQRETRQTRKWYAFLRDPQTGRELRYAGYTDKRLTEQMLARLEREQAQIAEGVLPPQVNQLRRPLLDVLPDYLATLKAKGDTAGHLTTVEARLRAILAGARLARWIDLDPDPIAVYLAGRREKRPRTAEEEEELSAQTSNHYVAAIKGFAAWLGRRLKLANPLTGLRKVNVDADRRHVRRALELAEFGRLLLAADGGPVCCGLSGPDRAVLYLVAAYTGLRASALASLTPEVIQLAGEPPTFTLAAAANKSRKQKTWPLHPAVAARLAEWLAGKPSGQKLWPSRWAVDCRAAEMLRADLARCEPPIPYRDAQDRVADFHCLRHTYLTNLARAGVPLAHAQKLAGHSTPVLTANFYTHLEQADLAAELRKLPAPPNTTAPERPAEPESFPWVG